MTRTLDARSTELSRRGSLAPILLVKLTTFTDRKAGTVDTIHYWSDRPLRYDYGNTGVVQLFDPFVARIGDISDQMDHLPGQNEQFNLGRDLTITVRNAITESGAHLLSTLDAEGLEAGRVEVSQLLVNTAIGEEFFDLSSLTGDQHVVFYRGEVNKRGRADAAEFDLECIAEIPSLIPAHIVSDITINDPKDIGKELPTVYGSVKHMPVINWEVGHSTTLGAPISAAFIGWVFVADNSGFSVPTNAWVGGEKITITAVDTFSGLPRIWVNVRAVSGTVAAVHSAGEIVVEIPPNGVTLVVADHAVGAIPLLYVRNPATGELVVENGIGSYTPNLSDTTLIPGRTVASLNIPSPSVDVLFASLTAQAKITQQPFVTDTGATVFSQNNEIPISGPINARDGNPATSELVGGGGNIAITLGFTNHAGTNISGTLKLVLDAPFRGSYNVNGTTLSGGGTFFVSSTSDSVQISIVDDPGFTGSGQVEDVQRDITWQTTGGASITTPVISQGQAQGFGLEFFADVLGVVAPDSTYQAAPGALIQTPADIMRHIIQVGAGLSSAIDETQWAIAEVSLTLLKHSFARQDIGETFEEVVSALGFESRSQLIQVEAAVGTQYRLLAATNPSAGVYSHGGGTRTLTEWESASEDGRSLDDITTRWRAIYDLDRSRTLNAEEPFNAVLNVSVDESDVPGISTADMIAAEASFGPRVRPPVLFTTIADLTTAERVLGYHVTEGKRVASVTRLVGVPWVEGYDTEIGDIVDTQLAWWPSPKTSRVIQFTKRSEDELADLILVEVV